MTKRGKWEMAGCFVVGVILLYLWWAFGKPELLIGIAFCIAPVVTMSAVMWLQRWLNRT